MMKFCDICTLIKREYKYEKMEWVFSVVSQILIFSCTFFLLSLTVDIDRLSSEYLGRLYPDGYTFELSGYQIEHTPELERMGFYGVHLKEGENTARIDYLDGIWLKKIKAILSGKDIWNEEIDEALMVFGTFQAVFGAMALIMVMIMLNNLSNSYAMKLTGRKHYIKMLFQLGCTKKNCQMVYYGFFSSRNIVAVFVAVLLNMAMTALINRRISELFHLETKISGCHLTVVMVLLVVVQICIHIAFRRIWREIDDIS